MSEGMKTGKWRVLIGGQHIRARTLSPWGWPRETHFQSTRERNKPGVSEIVLCDLLIKEFINSLLIKRKNPFLISGIIGSFCLLWDSMSHVESFGR